MSTLTLVPGYTFSPEGGSSVVITADDDIATWHVSDGTVTTIGFRRYKYTLPNRTETTTIYGTGPQGTSNTLTFSVLALLPNYWDYAVPVYADKDVLIYRPQKGPTQTRTLSDGDFLVYQLGSDRIWENYFYEILAFWRFHHPGKSFLLFDPTLQTKMKYESDGRLNFSPQKGGFFSWNWQIRMAYPYGVSY